MPDQRKLEIHDSTIRHVSIYYIFLGVLTLSLLILIYSTQIILTISVYLSTSLAAISGCSLYYIRKIYKDIYKDEKYTYTCEHSNKTFATSMYFYTRPLFSVALNWLAINATKAGIYFISLPSTRVDEANLIYLNCFIAFVIGFKVGNSITTLENYQFSRSKT